MIEPCFGIGHNLSLICQLTSEDIKHHFIIISPTTPHVPLSESRRDQEEGGDLDSHEEVRSGLSRRSQTVICGSRRDQGDGGGAGPSREPRIDQEQGGGAGLRKLDLSFTSVVPQQLCY